jgi:hypothetical protein
MPAKHLDTENSLTSETLLANPLFFLSHRRDSTKLQAHRGIETPASKRIAQCIRALGVEQVVEFEAQCDELV